MKLGPIRYESKTRERNHNWKGDDAGYAAIHEWIRRRKPKPKVCEDCSSVPPHDLANVSGKYRRDISDYRWLCQRCHKVRDASYDLTGLRFGRILVLWFSGISYSLHSYRRRWLCQCDCGNVKIITQHHLTSGATKSCGCLSAELCAESGERARLENLID